MFRLILLIILPTVLATGCWDITDIKDVIIPSIAGYDYNKETDKFTLFVNYPVFGQTEKKADVIVSQGKTVAAARIERGNKSERIVSLGDLKGFILSKDFARHGTENLDIIFRNPVLSLTQKMAVVDGKAEDVFYLTPPNSRSIGDHFIEMFENSPKNNFIPDETLYNFMINTGTAGFNAVLPVISVQGNDIRITGAALFKKYKMVAMVNEEDMRVLTWLRGEGKNGDIEFELTDEKGKKKKATFEGSNRRKVKAYLENGTPVFEIEIKLNGVIIEIIDNYKLADNEQHVEAIKKALENKVKRQCESFIEDLQHKYQVDAILLGKYARVYWPELVQQDWDENFCRSIIHVNVEANIQGSGERA